MTTIKYLCDRKAHTWEKRVGSLSDAMNWKMNAEAPSPALVVHPTRNEPLPRSSWENAEYRTLYSRLLLSCEAFGCASLSSRDYVHCVFVNVIPVTTGDYIKGDFQEVDGPWEGR